jgi:hypothetical protein
VELLELQEAVEQEQELEARKRRRKETSRLWYNVEILGKG